MPLRNYGNDRDYTIARLRRDGFDQLADSVEGRKLSARFARELAITVPREHLEEVTRYAVKWGPRCPPHWDGWEGFLDLARHAERATEPMENS